MLKPVARLRRRTVAGVLMVLLAAPAVAVGTASAAQADTVRQQEVWVLNATTWLVRGGTRTGPG